MLEPEIRATRGSSRYRSSITAIYLKNAGVGRQSSSRMMPSPASPKNHVIAELTPSPHPRLDSGNFVRTSQGQSTASTNARTSATRSASPALPVLAASQARNSLAGLAARTAEKTRRVASGRLKAMIRTGGVGKSTTHLRYKEHRLSIRLAVVKPVTRISRSGQALGASEIRLP